MGRVLGFFLGLRGLTVYRWGLGLRVCGFGLLNPLGVCEGSVRALKQGCFYFDLSLRAKGT